MTVSTFDDEYRFLSNFHIAPITVFGLHFTNTEAAFQAAKTFDETQRKQFTVLNPSIAKRMGRSVTLRPDWEEVKDQVMYDVVKAKFTQHPNLREKLLATGDAELIEGNTWHDNVWGNCSCDKCKNIPGQNRLGKTLMKVRSELAASA